jgi:hypothetical protein
VGKAAGMEQKKTGRKPEEKKPPGGPDVDKRILLQGIIQK